MTVAEIILAQLGGNTFLAMTGAKHLTQLEDSLMFRLPTLFSKDGINHVIIRLDPSDTYSLTFGRIRNFEYTAVSKVEGIYEDVLRDVFTRHTGLETSLGRFRNLETQEVHHVA